ncbi:MAG TPA: DUF3489 domain-containing protein [Chthoniobacterales bacterium]|nr:DUF3489 domain-containing protein [Chthoniobacterales bacterium]
MTKLNDIQLVVLTGAAKRDNRSLLPPPASVAGAGDRLTTALASLQKLGLAEEGPAKSAKAMWRTDDDERRVGLFITDRGRSAINVEPDPDASGGGVEAPAPPEGKPERQTKGAAILALLERPTGATLAEMIEATGWLPHTTRAALTGVRKKGFSVEKCKRGEETCYRIIAQA